MAKTMRQVFGETLAELGVEFAELVVLDADVSSSTMTRLFQQQYPERFYNFGIAESNMAGAAAGMATAGLTPVISSFAFLLAVRALDPIHSLIAYNSLNVKIAGGYAGLSDHADGASHQGICDLSIFRAIPNMAILSPSDEETTKACVRAMLMHRGPVYLRLSRDVVGRLHGGDAKVEIGKALKLVDGDDVLIVATGMLVAEALDAADRLKKGGFSACVVESVSVKPLGEDLIAREAVRCGRVVTLEENNVLGGLGDAVCAAVCAQTPVPVLKLGMRDSYGESARDYRALLGKYGLDGASVAAAVRQFIRR